MSNNQMEIGRAALAGALARAGRRASAAAAVAAVVPLAMALTMPAAEAVNTCGGYCVSSPSQPTADGNNFDYSYTFSSAAGEGFVTQIELPEIQAGEFLTSGGSGAVSFLGTIPSGWTVSEQTNSAFGGGGATFKSPNDSIQPSAFLELTWGGSTNGVGSGDSPETFVLESATGVSIGSNAEVQFHFPSGEGFNTASIDPPTPDPVPEPGTLALIGTALAGLTGLRRRRKR